MCSLNSNCMCLSFFISFYVSRVNCIWIGWSWLIMSGQIQWSPFQKGFFFSIEMLGWHFRENLSNHHIVCLSYVGRFVFSNTIQWRMTIHRKMLDACTRTLDKTIRLWCSMSLYLSLCVFFFMRVKTVISNKAKNKIHLFYLWIRKCHKQCQL